MAILRNNLPIGFFDSGVGGLTVLKEVKRLLPNENFIYFGDTLHVPYGDKTIQHLQQYMKILKTNTISKFTRLFRLLQKFWLTHH